LPNSDFDVSIPMMRGFFGSYDVNAYFVAIAAHTKINRLITHAES
jgi:hypothetical protein